MNNIDKILLAREKRIEIINNYINEYDCLCLKANIMGENKNIFESFFLVNYFERIIEKGIPSFSLKKKFNSFDGPYVIYLYKKGFYLNLKEEAVKIEEENSLGRLIDLDVYINSTISISRGHLRKCLICDNPAFYCNRLKLHSYQELINKIDSLIYDKLEKIITDAIDQAIETELKLPYKFGCVCVNNAASHNDMNDEIMRKAKVAIIPYFKKMFKLSFGINNLDELFYEIRLIGLDAEKEMYKKTNGVNCYKGLIFLLGLLISSLGYFLKNQFDQFESIFENIKIMCKDLDKELKANDTFGLIAYQKHMFKGARHEAINGLVNVKENFFKCIDLSESNLEKILINIICDIDDTVMLKRAKTIEKYNLIKNMIKNISSLDELIKVNDYCIKENISVGGSCDILICVIFLKLINEKIKLDGESYA